MRKIIAVLVVISVCYACNEEDFLDLEPQNDQYYENYYKIPDHAEAAWVAMYEPLAWPEFYGNQYTFLNDLASDDFGGENPGGIEDNIDFDPDYRRVEGFYGVLYKGLLRTNIVLEEVTKENIPDIEDQRLEEIRTQALALRGIYLWYLVVHFGTAPAILEKPNPPGIYPNSDPSTTWSHVEHDLQSAISSGNLMKDRYTRETGAVLTEWGARAFLAKAYLYQQKWHDAERELEYIIDNGPHELITTEGNDFHDYRDAYQSVFTIDPFYQGKGGQWNKETLFEVEFSSYQAIWGQWLGWGTDGSQRAQNFGLVVRAGWRNGVGMPELYNEFEEGDPRRVVTLWSEGDILETRSEESERATYNVRYNPTVHGSWTDYMPKKDLYPIWYDNDYNYPNNFRIIRYADVLLMYAEAAFRANNQRTGKPLDALNQVRERVGLAPISTLSKEAIIHERRVELAWENIRYRDLIRWHRSGWIDIHDYLPVFEIGKDEWYPIPQKEIDLADGLLKQNPGYEEEEMP